MSPGPIHGFGEIENTQSKFVSKHGRKNRNRQETYEEVKQACVSSVRQTMVKLPDCQQIVKQYSIKTLRLQHTHTHIHMHARTYKHKPNVLITTATQMYLSIHMYNQLQLAQTGVKQNKLFS